MQDVDKNEGDDRDTKNDPLSIKLLVINHTNGKTLDDERVQTWSKESSRVVKPIVKRRPIARNLIGGKDDPSISKTRSLPGMVTDKNSPEISLTRSRGTKKSGACSMRKMFIYKRKPLRRSLQSKFVRRAISRKIGMSGQPQSGDGRRLRHRERC